MADRKKPKKSKQAAADASAGATLISHPRASRDIARAKGWGGIAGFLLVAFVSWRAGAAPADIGLRALGGGIAGWLVAWRCAVAVWTHLAIAEIRAARRRSEA